MWNPVKGIRLALMGLLILGVASGLSLTGCSKGDDTMNNTGDRLFYDGVIPAIDTSIPENIETATFALG